MKKIMILGAGTYQVPLIKTAKRMGLYTIVVSIPGNYPGFSYADKVYYEDTRDYDAIVGIAKEESVSGILTAGTDVAVPTIGRVCDELGLHGISFEAAQIAANKMLMKEKYEQYGVRTAKFRKVGFDVDLVKKAAASLRFPLMFKAVDTSGSRGIVRVNSEDEFESAMQVTRAATKLDYFIVEEFVEGDEFGAQAFVQNGELQFILPHGDYVFHGDTGVPIGHYAPYEISNQIVEDARKQLAGAVKAMGLDNCAINADFILSNGEVYVLELGGRSGATCLAELTSIYYGYDYYEKMILASLGETVDFGSTLAVPNASMLLRSEKTGVICDQKYDKLDDSNVLDVQFDYQVGDAVRSFHVGPDRIGHVITKGETLDEATKLLHKAISNIHISVQ